jgi:hypothetical protein
MAKHESEMHRHRRELLDAMQTIADIAGNADNPEMRLREIHALARVTIERIRPPGGLK